MKRLLALLFILCLPLTALADVPAQVQAPDHLTLDPIVTNTGGTTITIDAEVEVPQVDGLNVYPITPLTITPDMVYALCREMNMGTLCGKKKDGTPIPIGKINGVEDIEFVKNDYVTAYGPDDVSMDIHVRGDAHEVYVTNSLWRGKPFGCQIQLQLCHRNFDYDYSMQPFLPDESMEGCAYSRAEAEEMAVRLASCIDPNLTVEYKGIATGSHWLSGWTEAELKAELESKKDIVIPNGYSFIFTRMVDGVRVAHSQYQGIGADKYDTDPPMRPPFQNENVYVTVTDQGIDTLTLYNGYSIGEPTQTDVELLPFDQIITTASAIFPLKYMPQENAYGGQYEYNYAIHRISLNYMRVLKENNPEVFELIPVWDFWGTNEYRWLQKDGTWSDWRSDGGDSYSYLTINAVTGLVVDREYAY